jgi:hypothetical protein
MNPRRRALAAVATLGVVAALFAFDGARTTTGAMSASECSIASMAAEFGFTAEPTQQRAVSAAKARDQVSELEPNATVSDELVGILRSERLPVVDGRVGLIFRLEGVIPPPAGSPRPDGARGQSSESGIRITCAISIFDAQTGEFLVSMGRGEPEN